MYQRARRRTGPPHALVLVAAICRQKAVTAATVWSCTCAGRTSSASMASSATSTSAACSIRVAWLAPVRPIGYGSYPRSSAPRTSTHARTQGCAFHDDHHHKKTGRPDTPAYDSLTSMWRASWSSRSLCSWARSSSQKVRAFLGSAQNGWRRLKGSSMRRSGRPMSPARRVQEHRRREPHKRREPLIPKDPPPSTMQHMRTHL